MLTINSYLFLTVLLLYLVPSFLYCLYNNLAFVNLSTYDPTTYYLLLQFRVVVTGVIFQVNIFNSVHVIGVIYLKVMVTAQLIIIIIS